MTIYYFADNQTGAHPSAAVGDNTNAGTSSAAPKRNFVGFNFDGLVAGDQVLLAIGGCWIAPSGETAIRCERADALDADNPIIFGTYDPGGGVSGRPWIKGDGQFIIELGANNGSPTGVYHGGYTIRGLHLDSLDTYIDNGDAFDASTIKIWSNNWAVLIEDCVVRGGWIGIDLNLGPDSFGDQGRYIDIHQCEIYDHGFTGWLGAGSDILIENCAIHNNGLNLAEGAFHHGIYYGGGRETQQYYRAVIRHNDLYDNNTVGGSMQGGHLTVRGRLNYTTIENNLVRTSGTQTGGSYAISHSAAYSDPESHYKTVIRGNRTYNITRGINFGSAPGIVVENNVHVDLTTGNTQAAGGIVGATAGGAGDEGDGQAKIRNNSIYIYEQRTGAYGIGIEGAAGTGIQIDNNAIVFGAGSAGTSYAFSLTETGGVTYTSIRNNFLGGSFSGWHSGYASLANFESHFDALSGTDCSGNVENATTGLTTPTLVNNLNMVPTSGASPVVDAALAGITKLAVDGYARETARDIGAFEYGRNP
jgi:hypothetical protein